ncbi:MeaB bZIP transcription factor [Ophiocordyceps sinensis CO18]|uniref:MeaB bZIP transcription factor n=1 Tax=Ophiocordyceps sinensis (strain Co18 / CGMCC 3.14243) TaxID=911162 RepID=T5A6Q4_OPHSC|nr:MeaB bZIP transcription factor [Ophiocordyceps sinensis CO18]
MRGSGAGLSRHPLSTPTTNSTTTSSLLGRRGHSAADGASFYPTPSFQNPVEQQMEREYDGMVDDSEMETPNGHGSYPPGFTHDTQHTMMLSPSSTAPGPQMPHPHEPTQQAPGSPFPSMTQLLHQNLDWDPFGLSASMAFPNQQPFQYDQANMR